MGGALAMPSLVFMARRSRSSVVDRGAKSFHEKAGVSQVCFCFSSLWFFFAFEPSRLCRHPSIRTLLLSDYRSVQVGRSRFSRCCYLIIDLGSPLFDGSWART